MLFRNKKIYILALGLVFMLFSGTYAINVINEGWQLSPATVTNIDVHANCKKITTPNDGKTRFIPTKTVAEWNSFLAAAPGQGIILDSCAPPVVNGWCANRKDYACHSGTAVNHRSKYGCVGWNGESCVDYGRRYRRDCQGSNGGSTAYGCSYSQVN